jgi:hypothetical protein
MKNILFLIIMTAFLTLFGCNSTSFEDKFNKNTYEEDIATLSEKKLLNEEDSEILTSYIALNEADSIALSKPYAELLSIAKKEKELTDKIAKEIAEEKKILNESLTVKVTRKYTQNLFDEGYLKNFLLVDIVAQNNTDKKLSGFSVKINFKSADGITFYAPEWPVQRVIKAKSKISLPLSTGEYDNTNPEQAKLKVADLSKIKIEYEILELLYDDGTSLSIR